MTLATVPHGRAAMVAGNLRSITKRGEKEDLTLTVPVESADELGTMTEMKGIADMVNRRPCQRKTHAAP